MYPGAASVDAAQLNAIVLLASLSSASAYTPPIRPDAVLPEIVLLVDVGGLVTAGDDRDAADVDGLVVVDRRVGDVGRPCRNAPPPKLNVSAAVGMVCADRRIGRREVAADVEAAARAKFASLNCIAGRHLRAEKRQVRLRVDRATLRFGRSSYARGRSIPRDRRDRPRSSNRCSRRCLRLTVGQIDVWKIPLPYPDGDA